MERQQHTIKREIPFRNYDAWGVTGDRISEKSARQKKMIALNVTVHLQYS